MKSNYLLSYKYKNIGWLLFTIGLIGGLYLLLTGYESNIFTIKVFSIYSDNISLFNKNESGFFSVIENSIIDELSSILIIIGGLFIGFSKEKVEDEFIYKLRKDSLAWAIIINYAVLIFAILFIYELTFFHVLVFNMFLPIIFFIFRFNFLKRQHDIS